MKKRVLVVDDVEAFNRLIKINLERTGNYVVQTENWAEDAVAAAKKFKPHIVLLDVIMPGIFGGEVANRLKADPELTSIPIVFLSASVSKTRVDEHDGMIGGYPFIAKPASTETIVEAIEKYALKPAEGAAT